MGNIKFPFVTIVTIGALIVGFFITQTIIESQRISITEEEMSIESLKHDVFSKHFSEDFIYDVKRGDSSFIEHCWRIYQEYLNVFLNSDNFQSASAQVKNHLKAREEAYNTKTESFLLNSFGASKRASVTQTLITSATSLFIHLNILHLAIVCVLVWIIGINAEKIMGLWYFLLLYGGGIAVNYASIMILPENVLIFGLMPGVAVLFGAFLLHNYDEESSLLLPGVLKTYGIFLVFPFFIAEAVMAVVIQNETYKTFSFMHVGGIILGILIALVFKVAIPKAESAISAEKMTPLDMAKRDIKMGNYKGAIDRLHEITRKDPANSEALKLMMQAYITSRGQAECTTLMNQVLPDLVKRNNAKLAFDLYMDFSNTYPTAMLTLDAQLVAGKLLCDNDFYEMGIAALTKVTQVNPGSEQSIEAVFYIGKMQLEKLNQPQQAAAMFNWIVQNFPAHRLTPQSRQLIQQAQSRMSGI